MFKKLQVRIAVFISVILILTVVAVQVGSNLVLRPLIERDAKTTTAATAESMRDIIALKLENYGDTINKLATSTLTEDFAQKQTKQTLAFENDELKGLQEQDELISLAYIGTSDGKMFAFRSPILVKGMIRLNETGIFKQLKSLTKSYGQIRTLIKQQMKWSFQPRRRSYETESSRCRWT